MMANRSIFKQMLEALELVTLSEANCSHPDHWSGRVDERDMHSDTCNLVTVAIAQAKSRLEAEGNIMGRKELEELRRQAEQAIADAGCFTETMGCAVIAKAIIYAGETIAERLERIEAQIADVSR